MTAPFRNAGVCAWAASGSTAAAAPVPSNTSASRRVIRGEDFISAAPALHYTHRTQEERPMRRHFSVRGGLASIALVVLAGDLWIAAQVRDFTPVTENMLRNPAAGDWLNWRRTDNAWGYSPLEQITRRNVQQLGLAWSWAMESSGAQEATPLVYNGIMYLPNPGGVIQALDGATGDLIWEYRPDDSQRPAH